MIGTIGRSLNGSSCIIPFSSFRLLAGSKITSRPERAVPKVCGAPIKVDRAHLKDGYAQAIIVNSGNANTCAANGVALAEECCELVGKELGIDPTDAQIDEMARRCLEASGSALGSAKKLSLDDMIAIYRAANH